MLFILIDIIIYRYTQSNYKRMENVSYRQIITKEQKDSIDKIRGHIPFITFIREVILQGYIDNNTKK